MVGVIRVLGEVRAAHGLVDPLKVIVNVGLGEVFASAVTDGMSYQAKVTVNLGPVDAGLSFLGALAAVVAAGGTPDFTYPASTLYNQGAAVSVAPTVVVPPLSYALRTFSWKDVPVPELPRTDPATAYIEVTPTSYSVLSGPRIGTYSVSRHGSASGVGFHALADAIWEAGLVSSAPANPVIRVNGDIQAVQYGGVRLGTATATRNRVDVWWSTLSGSGANTCDPVNSSPRPIVGLTIVGKNPPQPTTFPWQVVYPDKIEKITLGEFGANAQTMAVDAVRFEGLDIVSRVPGQGTGGHPIEGAGNIGAEHRFGLLTLVSCRIYKPIAIDGKECKSHVRLFHTRGSLHFQDVVYGENVGLTPSEHNVYIDYGNDSRAGYRRSYFNRCTNYASGAGRTFFQGTGRQLEATVGGTLNIPDGARGLTIFQDCIAFNCSAGLGNNSAAWSIVGHAARGTRSAPEFPEDGTVILRRCRNIRGPANITGGSNGFFHRSLLVWEDAADCDTTAASAGICTVNGTDGKHGIYYDPWGFHTTRIVIDDFQVGEDITRSGIATLGKANGMQDESHVQIAGCGDVLVYGFGLGNDEGKTAFLFDEFINTDARNDTAIYTANRLSNNPPVDFDFGTGLVPKGTRRSTCGLVRFFVPNLSSYSGWGLANKVRVYGFDGQKRDMTSVQIDSLVASDSLPTGTALNTSSGLISGTATDVFPQYSRTGNLRRHLIQEAVGQTYPYNTLAVPGFGLISIGGTNAVGTSTDQFMLGVQQATFQLGDQIAIARVDPLTVSQKATANLGAVFASGVVEALTVQHIQQFTFQRGINIHNYVDYETGRLTKRQSWQTGPWSYKVGTMVTNPDPAKGGVLVVTDANGFPTFQDPLMPAGAIATSNVLLTTSGVAGRYPAGVWTLRWTGTPNAMAFAGSGSILGAVVSQTPNQIKRTINASGGSLAIDVTLAGVTSWELWAPGQDPQGEDPNPTAVLMPQAKADLLRVVSPAGAVRFMDLSGVNYCGTGIYEGAPLAGVAWLPPADPIWPHKLTRDPRYTSGRHIGELSGIRQTGIPTETMVAICNELARSLWVNVPHEYGPGQQRAMLEYVRDNLAPGLYVVVELANEIWNSAFPAKAWVTFNTGQTSPNNATFQQFVADKLAALFAVADSVFAGTGRAVFKYVGGQLGNTAYCTGVVNKIPTTISVDALGPPLYANPNATAYTASTTQDTIINDMLTNISKVGGVNANIAEHNALCVNRAALQGKPCLLVSYEAGQHVVTGQTPQGLSWLAAATGVQRNPRMAEVYLALKNVAQSNGMSLVMWFGWCGATKDQFGAWGHQEYLGEAVGSGNPKLDSIALVTQATVQLGDVFATVTVDNLGLTLGKSASLGTVFATGVVDALRIVQPTQLGQVSAQAIVDPIGFSTLPSTEVVLLGDVSATGVVDALDPRHTFHPVAPASRSYKLPEQPSYHARAILNVFEQDPAIAVRPSGGRPVFLTAAAFAFFAADPLAEIDSAFHPLFYQLIVRGWTVVIIGISGLPTTTDIYDGYGTTLWNTLTQANPWKDMVLARKWIAANAAASGMDNSRVVAGGYDSAGVVAATMALGVETPFAAVFSPQALAATTCKGVLALWPFSRYLAFVQNLISGKPFVAAAGGQANTLAEVARTLLDDFDISGRVRATGARSVTTPCFIATDDLMGSADYTRATAPFGQVGDPNLEGTLLALHDAWFSVMLYLDLVAKAPTLHQSRSKCLLDANVNTLGTNFHTGTFSGGIGGADLVQQAVDWMEGIGGQFELGDVSATAHVDGITFRTGPTSFVLGEVKAAAVTDELGVVSARTIILQDVRPALAIVDALRPEAPLGAVFGRAVVDDLQVSVTPAAVELGEVFARGVTGVPGIVGGKTWTGVTILAANDADATIIEAGA